VRIVDSSESQICDKISWSKARACGIELQAQPSWSEYFSLISAMEQKSRFPFAKEVSQQSMLVI
jgi:hypothetical protein